MSVSSAVREVWTPGDRAVEASSGLGSPPKVAIITMPSPNLARHRILLTALTLAALAVGPASAQLGTWWVPPILLCPILLLAGMLLRLPAVTVVVIASAISALVASLHQLRPADLLVSAMVAVLALRLSYVRGSVGLRGLQGDRALLQLKSRLRALNELPALPEGWGRKASIRQAPRELFGGDFVVSHREGSRLEMVLVDVSGKGPEAASWAIELSGLLGGLIGQLSPRDLLARCNDHLLHASERDRLVTAIHLDLDLGTGEYTIHCAGHPPAARYDHGSGTWEPCQARGIALGIVDDPQWEAVNGRLDRNDALMLCTNGMWGPHADPQAGMDRLLGHADALLQNGGFAEMATQLGRTVEHRQDDSALVLIWRK